VGSFALTWVGMCNRSPTRNPHYLLSSWPLSIFVCIPARLRDPWIVRERTHLDNNPTTSGGERKPLLSAASPRPAGASDYGILPAKRKRTARG